MKALIIAVALFATVAGAQSNQDTSAYCRYVEEQGKAQEIVSVSPVLTSGITPAQGTAPQQFVGVTDSINNIRKGRLDLKIGHEACVQYIDTVTVQERIQYDMLSLDRAALSNRLSLIAQATQAVNALIVDNQKLLDSHNLPKQSVYLLDKQRLALELDRQATAVAVADIYVPELSDASLTNLAEFEYQSAGRSQVSQYRLAKMNEWDVAVSTGIEKPMTPFLSAASPYAGVTVTYDLGRRAANKHYDASLEAYATWKRAQVGDVIQNVQAQHGVVIKILKVQQDELKALTVQDVKIVDTMASIADSSTTAALVFRNQLRADEFLLRVQILDTTFRVASLQRYLYNNFDVK